MPLDTEAAARSLRRTDPVMRHIVKTVGPCGLKPGARGDHFTTLLRAIVGQQLSSKAAETIWNRLTDLHDDHRKVRPEDVLSATTEQLRATGLSNAKVTYVRDLAQRVADGSLRLNRLSRLDDERVIDQLVAVHGIGRWTAEMFLMFKLGRPDVWPVGDLGIRNAIERHYRLEPTKANLATVAEPWRPWRSVASWYLWRSLDIEPV